MKRLIALRLTFAGGAVALLLSAACRPVPERGPRFREAIAKAGISQTPDTLPLKGNKQLYPVAPPPFSKDAFPCSDCHGKDDKVDKVPHKVEFHEKIVLHHDEKNRWCLDCHDAQLRDSLHLADGRRVPFTESYRLCGQCHGPTLRNWKAGEHGKRTGFWNGTKQYLLCPSCHNPHSPHFQPLEPKHPPLRPEAIK